MSEQRRFEIADSLFKAGFCAFSALLAHEFVVPLFQDHISDMAIIQIEPVGPESLLDPEPRLAMETLIQSEFREVTDYWAAQGIQVPGVRLDTDFILDDSDTCYYPGSSNLNPGFCSANNTIYFSPESVMGLMDEASLDGPIITEIVIGHEFAHAIQLQYPQASPASEIEQMSRELQADCMGAAAMTELPDDDLADLQKFLRDSLGDDTPDLRSHGTGEQRAAAFREGLDGNCPKLDTMLATVDAAIG